MSEHDIVAEWLQAAYDDYDSAKYLFDRPHKKALEIICYHCQQSAEKSLKAFLVANGVVITKTHDTGILYRQCAEIESTFSKFEKICEELTIYATETRYPIRIEVDEATAERLLQQSQEIYNFVFGLVKPSEESPVKESVRCPWADGDGKMTKYHDEVWGKPEHDDQRLFAKLCLDIMQAGLMWRTILHKQENFYEAFDGFHIETVAAYGELKYEELMQNAGIVRNRLKIRAIINNAARVLEIQKEFGSFDAYLWSFTDGNTVKNAWENIDDVPASTPLSDKISKDMKNRGFRFVGTTIIYAFLQAVGIVNDHLTSCFCYEQERRI